MCCVERRTSDAPHDAQRQARNNPTDRRRSRWHFHCKGVSMATRRTTMRSRTGTKLYAVRDKSGQFKDIQSYKKAHAADLRRTSKAEADAKGGLASMEKKVEKAARKAVKTVRAKFDEARANKQVVAMEKKVGRAAKKAVKTVRAKLDEARTNKKVVAMEKKVGRAAKKAAKTVRASLTDAMAAVKRAAKKVTKQVSAKKPAAKKAVKKAAKGPAKRAAKKA
jgi:hypothetical protein